ncbi:PulJ/GspJ family protein [Agarivorans gilvus]|uniref:Prepilin-type N-terminal cleavage/methylation domain-containing protein n=1 Tax=Agarivorans gilvus TaxID=680279 RepID=A0ABQ1HYA8_9ALTE|nr:prepilin-type N-terminal cleavage/methylation domain-containing protein [Agarivorans gilvus]GGA98869.1 hypothetical protein GCM10007414_09870 [Agarivorans gilvus]
MKNNKGFSLVEMLVAMVLLTGVISVASFAYSQFSRYWEGSVGRFYDEFYEIRQKNIVRDIIGSVIPYVAYNKNEQSRYYFEGHASGFVGISRNSFSFPGQPAVIRVFSEQNTDFTYELIYQESPMYNSYLTSTTEQVDFTYQITIDEGLQSVAFKYYGVTEEDVGELEQRKLDWFNDYNALVRMTPPERISITWTDNDIEKGWYFELTKPDISLGRFTKGEE